MTEDDKNVGVLLR